MDMEANISSSHAKRFVIEDSYTKVTADGEPHEMMTLIAGLSGLAAAIVILIVLISLVACKKDGGEIKCKKCPTGLNSKQCKKAAKNKANNEIQRSSVSTVSSRISSIPECNEPNFTTDFAVISGTLKGNLNAAFENSEQNITNSLLKSKKKTRWQDEVTVINMLER